MTNGYDIELGRLDRESWEEVIRPFDDGSIYQSWSWGAVRRGEKNIEHAVLRKDGGAVAAAQTWVMRLPLLGRGIAYVKWGPMWRTADDRRHAGHYRYMVRALRDEYAGRRGLVLRIMPGAFGDGGEMRSVLMDEGFIPCRDSAPYRTLLMDLSLGAGELKGGLKRQWRQCLNKAERNGLSVRNSATDDMLDAAVRLYREMHSRKRFAQFLDIEEMKKVQRLLPDDAKMNVFVCESKGRTLSACIVSHMGDTAIGMFAATCGEGFELRSSHLLQWRIVEWLKARGCRWYDLGGIEPKRYAGTYLFKVGLSGKHGRDETFIDYDFSEGLSSRAVVQAGDRLRSARRRLKEWTAGLRKS